MIVIMIRDVCGSIVVMVSMDLLRSGGNFKTTRKKTEGVIVCICVYMCVCACARERERENEVQTGKEARSI